jgi:hypothetical protein
MVFAAAGRAAEGAAYGQRARVHFPSTATVLRRHDWHVGYPAGNAVEQRTHRIVHQPATQGVSEPQSLKHPARGPRGHQRLQGGAQPTTSPLSAGLPNTRRVRCGVQMHPHPGGLRDQLNPVPNNPTLNSGGLSIGDSPLGLDRRQQTASSATTAAAATYAFSDAECPAGRRHGAEVRILCPPGPSQFSDASILRGYSPPSLTERFSNASNRTPNPHG